MSWDRVKAMNALRSGDLLELGMSANQIRQHLHPAGVVTYALGGPAPAQRAVTPAFPVAKDNSISLTSVRDVEHVSVDALKALIVAQRGQLPGVTFQHLPVSSRHRFAQDLVALGRALPALDAAGLGSICIELKPNWNPTRSGQFWCACIMPMLRMHAVRRKRPQSII
jgi:hypothetical protein